jgi:hypothetical protein
MKYCETCRLCNKQQKQCGLSGLPVDPATDYCSKYDESVIICDVCHNPLLVTNSFIRYEGEKTLLLCQRCNFLYKSCQSCQKARECEFETNPNPLPKMVMKTLRQGNTVMQIQTKNEERVKLFCLNCACWLEDCEACGKEFGIGCNSHSSSKNVGKS